MELDLPSLGGKTLTCKAQNLMFTCELQEVTSCWQPISHEVPQADPSGRVASVWAGREEQYFLQLCSWQPAAEP